MVNVTPCVVNVGFSVVKCIGDWSMFGWFVVNVGFCVVHVGPSVMNYVGAS